MFEAIPTPLQQLESNSLSERDIRLYIKRDDLIHPFISGNKWRKLKYNLIKAKEEGCKTLLTFGGAYSNHIAAVSKAGEEFDFKTIGCIRGEEYEELNSTLQMAADSGMQLTYINREQYRKKNNQELIEMLKEQFSDFYLIPEGGTNELALPGCKELVEEIGVDFDVIACACGTGGTLSGIIQGLKGGQHAMGFPVLKGAEFLRDNVRYLSGTSENWELNLYYHFGGYARITEGLLNFIEGFKRDHQILLDPVYTGKLLFGIFDLVEKDYFKEGTTLVAVHTGGLQGWKGFLERGMITKGYYESIHSTTQRTFSRRVI